MFVVSLGVVNSRYWSHLGRLGRKANIFGIFRYRKGMYVEKFTKNAVIQAFRGQFKLEPHQYSSHFSLRGLNLVFRRASTSFFISESLPRD